MIDRTREFEFVYAESIRNLGQQSQVLDSIRSRAGLLIAAANVVTALLAGPTFAARGGASLGSWLAIAAFLVAVVLALAILWPRTEWNFRFGIADIVDRLDSRPEMDLNELQRRLALKNEESYVANEQQMDGLFNLFRWSTLVLIVEVVFWLTALLAISIGGVQL